jgi:hypothetical protein
MANKFTPVTDPAEIEELTTDAGDLAKPFPLKPNGHLWVDTDELRDWREGKK